jgi:hypothetical protein
LEALRYRAASLHALCIPFSDVEEASTTRLQAEQRLKRLQASPQEDGFNLPPEDARTVAAQRDLAKATAAFKLLNERREARAKAWADAARVLSAIDSWISDGRPRNAVLDDYEGPEPKLARGEAGLLDAIETRRRRVKELHAELDRIRSAPYPSSHAKQKMRSQIAALAQRGAASVSGLVKNDDEVAFQLERKSVPVVVTVGKGTGATVAAWQQFDSLGAFCWLHKDALVAKLDREIEAAADDKNSLSSTDREKAEARVLSEQLAIEREESSFVFEAQSRNLPVEHRADISPLAILGMQLVTAPRAALASPASSLEHAFGVVG